MAVPEAAVNEDGDLIVGFDGEEIATPQDLAAALNSHHPGDVVTLTVYRGQRQLNIKVTLSTPRRQAVDRRPKSMTRE